jgi:hypothetical protein
MTILHETTHCQSQWVWELDVRCGSWTQTCTDPVSRIDIRPGGCGIDKLFVFDECADTNHGQVGVAERTKQGDVVWPCLVRWQFSDLFRSDHSFVPNYIRLVLQCVEYVERRVLEGDSTMTGPLGTESPSSTPCRTVSFESTSIVNEAN